ncbi:MAG TPA: hypothetical protein VHM26_06445 [Chitinophagaceae bacterium]|nr:hypothetical protein [Chitinophagaceae bacterium]
MAVSFKPIRPLLQTGASAVSRWFSYIGLGIGVMLLLCSVQLFISVQQLLTKTSTVNKEGYDFISITKQLPQGKSTDRSQTLFKQSDFAEIKAQPFVVKAAPLIANDFRVQMSAGSIVPFSTDLFLETVETDFLDTIPSNFTWTKDQPTIPIIIAADFFDIYNVFAPGQGLPQISREMAYTLPLQITCSGNGGEAVFIGKIVAFSERVNSVLVPKSFLDWANNEFGTKRVIDPGRIFIKTKDANDPALLKFLDQKGYKVKKDSTLIGRNKILIQGVFSGLGVFGLLVVILALLLFSFYLQLVIARSRESLLLLITLGYSPGWLSRGVSKMFIPVYSIIIFIALVLAALMNWFFYENVKVFQPGLSPVLHWSVFVLAVALVAFSVFNNYRMVKRLLTRMTGN